MAGGVGNVLNKMQVFSSPSVRNRFPVYGDLPWSVKFTCSVQ